MSPPPWIEQPPPRSSPQRWRLEVQFDRVLSDTFAPAARQPQTLGFDFMLIRDAEASALREDYEPIDLFHRC
jgi:hypothetical protein